MEKFQGFFKAITKFLHLNKSLSRYLVFLLVSLLFWFLTVMSKEYETTVVVPVQYINFPESQQLINKPENQIEIKVKSHGFYLLSKNLSKAKPLVISVKDLVEVKTKKYGQKYYLVNRNHRRLQKLFSADMQILSATPDSLFVRYQQKATKKVVVNFDGDIQFAPQFRMKDKIQIFPDSIFIFGTAENLTKISAVQTKRIDFSLVEDSVKQMVKLQPQEDISFTEKKVEISFKVEKFTEKIIELLIKPINVPQGYKIKCYPQKVKIVTTVAFADYEKLNASLFIAEVDGSDMENRKKLEVVLRKQAPFTNILRIKPASVEFLLIRL